MVDDSKLADAAWTKPRLAPPEKLVALAQAPGEGMIDSGCGRAMVGEETLQEHEALLRNKGLQVVRVEDEVATTFRFGNDEVVQTNKRALIPAWIDKRSVVLNVFIVPGRALLLLSKPMLKELGGRLDFDVDTLELAGGESRSS